MTKTGLEFLVTLADCRKGERVWKPPRGQSKAGSFGSGFFTTFKTHLLCWWYILALRVE